MEQPLRRSFANSLSHFFFFFWWHQLLTTNSSTHIWIPWHAKKTPPQINPKHTPCSSRHDPAILMTKQSQGWTHSTRSLTSKRNWQMFFLWSPWSWITSPYSGCSITVPLQANFWRSMQMFNRTESNTTRFSFHQKTTMNYSSALTTFMKHVCLLQSPTHPRKCEMNQQVTY